MHQKMIQIFVKEYYLDCSEEFEKEYSLDCSEEFLI